jgi:PAS domain S-box-containing protein
MPETKLQMEHLGKYFYNLAERSQDIFWIRSADYTQVYYVSPAYQKIWGLSCESLYENSNSWLEQVLADDKDRVQAEIAQVANGGSNQDIYLLSYKLKRAEATVWIKESIFPLFNDKAQCIGYAGIAKDVSQDKKKKTDLETASRFFRFFAERTQSVFWVRDPKYNKQLYVSPAYEKIWGRSRKSLYDDPNTWIETLVPEDRDGGHTPAVRFQLLEEQGSTVYYENRYRIKTKKTTLLVLQGLPKMSLPMFYTSKNCVRLNSRPSLRIRLNLSS